MKRHFLACVLALPLAAIQAQESFAWCKFNFGIGANIGYQSGGNKSFLWGAWSSADCPNSCNSGCCAGGGCPGGGCAPGYCGPYGCGGNYGGLSGYPAGFQAPGPKQLGPFGQDFSEGWMSPMSKAKPETPASKETDKVSSEPTTSTTQPVGAFYQVVPGYGYDPTQVGYPYFYGYGWNYGY